MGSATGNSGYLMAAGLLVMVVALFAGVPAHGVIFVAVMIIGWGLIAVGLLGWIARLLRG